ncbi:MAG TPA: inorganic phosphate transporter [Chloroflexota bacterium]|nr:inorganic phosphate transporter [Chloroflexota bacterium]
MPDGRLVLLALVILFAFAFDYTNGFHDTANAIATSVSTHALSPRLAVGLSAVFNLAGAFLNTRVADTIGGLVSERIALVAILAGLVGAITWNLLTWMWGLPSSSSHALIGGIIGAALVSIGPSAVKWDTLQTSFGALVSSPIIGLLLGFGIMLALLWTFRRMAPGPLNKVFRGLQLLSASFISFSHGGNDAQKTMGIITLALVTYGALPKFAVPLWVIVVSAAAMALGTYSGGWRIIRTMGTRIIKLDPIHGFAADLSASSLITAATHFGLPVSTTHVVSGSLMGVGSTRRLSAVRWGVATNIVAAWLITIPASAAVAAIIYAILHWVLGISV